MEINDLVSAELEYALYDSNIAVRAQAAKHKNITTDQLWIALKDPAWEVREIAAMHRNIKADQVDYILEDPIEKVRCAVINNLKNIKQHNKALNDSSEYVLIRVVRKSPFTTKENLLEYIKNHHNIGVRFYSLWNDLIDSSHIEIAMRDLSDTIRKEAIGHSKATAEQIDYIMQHDQNARVREAAIANINASKEALHNALNDPDTAVRSAALCNPNADEKLWREALKNGSPDIRILASTRFPPSTVVSQEW